MAGLKNPANKHVITIFILLYIFSPAVLQNADATFDYSVQSERDTGMSDQWDNDTVLEPIRTVMLLSADKLPTIMQRMRAEYSQ